jgi:hypothetical protein
VFFEFIRNNGHYLSQFLDALISRVNIGCESCFENRFGIWIAQCIINDMPEEYYISLFSTANTVAVFKSMIEFLILSTNVHETEHSRIHYQVSRIVRIYSAELTGPRMLEFLEIINNIRFGHFDSAELTDLRILEYFKTINNIRFCFDWKVLHENRTKNFQLAKAALLANKKDLFRSICSIFNLSLLGGDIDAFAKFEDDFSLENHQVKNYIIFEMIQENHPENINESNERLLSFIMKFYAVKFLKLNAPGVVTFEFEVSEKLLDLGFPPALHISQNCDKVEGFIKWIFWHMNVISESTLTTFIPDLVEYSRITSIPTMFVTSGQFIEYISKLPNILQLLIDKKIKLSINFSVTNIENYFNLPNFELTRQILAGWTYFKLYHLSKLKTKEHLEKFEVIQGEKVSSYFLRWEGSPLVWGKFLYFEWRPFFAYWIKGSDKERIKEIKTPEIIEMLKLDFPDEAKKLFN